MTAAAVVAADCAGELGGGGESEGFCLSSIDNECSTAAGNYSLRFVISYGR